MEHSEATEKMIAEGYVLGELLPEERDAFEEHYFQCAECAEDVRSAATMRDSVQVVLHDAPKVIEFPSRWKNWWASAATVAAVAAGSMFGYVNYVTVPHLMQGYGVIRQAAPVELSAERGDGSTTELQANKAFRLDLAIHPDQRSTGDYRVAIRKGQRELRSYGIMAHEAKNFVSVTDPGLPAGEYTLALYGVPDRGQPLATHSLHVR